MGFISDNTKSMAKEDSMFFWGDINRDCIYFILAALCREWTNLNFWYFLIFNLIFYLELQFLEYLVAMGYEMSDDFHERTKIMAVSQFIGQFAWVLAPWIWIIIYDPNIFVDPASGTRVLSVVFGVLCTLLAIVPAIL